MTEAAELAAVEAELSRLEADLASLLERQSELLQKKKLLQKAVKANAEKAQAQDWEKTDYPWSDKLQKVLVETFKVPRLRPLQLSAMNCLLAGQDCLLVMPTGAGKSLCFQAPAVASEGLTLVISPLVSLMEDQLLSLTSLSIDCAQHLCASSEREHVSLIHAAMVDPRSPLRLLYVSPEKLAKSKTFMSRLQKSYEMGRLKRVVIDEVHCCSTWGHDFRPDYKFLSILKRQFPQLTLLGLTATATTSVLTDVRQMLHMNECIVLRAGFDRPNLFYQVLHKPAAHADCMDQLANMIRAQFPHQSGIIYCLTQKDCETVAADLKQRNITTGPYHANMAAAQRTRIHRGWIEGRVMVVVATIAFGMGIDKPDVRFVVHHSLSKSLENYYQESGRAGRDGGPAHCILLAAAADVVRQSTMVFTERTGLEKLYNMVDYMIATETCRRRLIGRHFGEDQSLSCSAMCDVCKRASQPSTTDVTKDAQSLMEVIKTSRAKNEKITLNKLLTAWYRKTKLRKEHAQQVVMWLLVDGYIQEDFHFTPYSTISYMQQGTRQLGNNLKITTIKPQTMVSFTTGSRPGTTAEAPEANSKEASEESVAAKHSSGKSKKPQRKRKNESESSENCDGHSSDSDFQPGRKKHAKTVKQTANSSRSKMVAPSGSKSDGFRGNGVISSDDDDCVALD